MSNVPIIRFQGFTDDWIQCKLGDVIEISSASRVHKDEWTKEGIPFFRSSDVTSIFKGTQNTKAFISYELYESLSEKSGKVKTHDVLATGGGSIAIPYLVPNDEPMYFKDADLIWMKTNETLEGRFLYNFFTSPTLRNYVQTISHVGTISHYTIEQAKDTPITLPSLKEQTAIGAFFRTLDNAIHNHQQKLNCLRELKKGYLQQMFPQDGESVPRVRFDGFTGNWQEIKLDKIVEFYSGLTYSPDNVIESGGTFVLRSSNVKDGEIINADNVYVESDAVNCPNVEVGDIIVVVRNGSRNLIGKHAQIREKMNDTVIGAFMTGLRSSQSGLINALLDTPQFEIEITKNLGATINQITIGAFKQMTFCIPTQTSEQSAIGDFFHKLNKQLVAQTQKLEKLKQLKAAYLQKMFV